MKKEVIRLSIAKEFSRRPGFRTREEGQHSGQEFYEDLLRGKFAEALDSEKILVIDLDGTEGYPSSFLSEAFRLLVKDYGKEKANNYIIYVSKESPRYIEKIKKFINE